MRAPCYHPHISRVVNLGCAWTNSPMEALRPAFSLEMQRNIISMCFNEAHLPFRGNMCELQTKSINIYLYELSDYHVWIIGNLEGAQAVKFPWKSSRFIKVKLRAKTHEQLRPERAGTVPPPVSRNLTPSPSAAAQFSVFQFCRRRSPWDHHTSSYIILHWISYIVSQPTPVERPLQTNSTQAKPAHYLLVWSNLFKTCSRILLCIKNIQKYFSGTNYPQLPALRPQRRCPQSHREPQPQHEAQKKIKTETTEAQYFQFRNWGPSLHQRLVGRHQHLQRLPRAALELRRNPNPKTSKSANFVWFSGVMWTISFISLSQLLYQLLSSNFLRSNRIKQPCGPGAEAWPPQLLTSDKCFLISRLCVCAGVHVYVVCRYVRWLSGLITSPSRGSRDETLSSSSQTYALSPFQPHSLRAVGSCRGLPLVHIDQVPGTVTWISIGTRLLSTLDNGTWVSGFMNGKCKCLNRTIMIRMFCYLVANCWQVTRLGFQEPCLACGHQLPKAQTQHHLAKCPCPLPFHWFLSSCMVSQKRFSPSRSLRPPAFTGLLILASGPVTCARKPARRIALFRPETSRNSQGGKNPLCLDA